MAGDAQRTEIGPNTVVAGDIHAQEDVVVFGRVEGSVTSTTAVIVEEGGEAQARIQATSVLIAGLVVGDVRATERVEVTPKGRVLGDIATPRLVLQDGGAIRGRVVMDASAKADTVAAPQPAQATSASRPYSYARPSAAAPANPAGARKTSAQSAAPAAAAATRRQAASATGRATREAAPRSSQLNLDPEPRDVQPPADEA